MLWVSPSKKRLLSAVSAGFLIFLFYTDAAYAAVSNYSAMDMLLNIAQQIPNLMRMVTAIAYVMGIYFIFFAIMKLKQYGEMRTMMASQHNLQAPIMYLIIGSLLIYLPTSVQLLTTTFWATPSPLGYEAASSDDQWASLLKACILVIQLFGTIAFIRGLVLLSHLSGHGGQPGTLGKAITHVIGGIFCINIYAFVQVIFATIGLSIT